jgi:uncharacterized protein YcaQ
MPYRLATPARVVFYPRLASGSSDGEGGELSAIINHPMLNLTLSTARQVHLAAQGLLVPPDRAAVKRDVLAAIRRMGALQIDTIHVVARSPYLVLWSRLGSYAPAWLDELLAEGALFEYWSHAACLLPVEDYPLYRRRMLDVDHGWWGGQKWLEAHHEVVSRVLDRIGSEGSLRSADFENGVKKPGGWWNWKDEKIALDLLHSRGDLMISRREKFQRVYDLRQQVMPGWQDEMAVPAVEMMDTLVLRIVKALGIARAGWVPDYFRLPKKDNAAVLKRLAEQGQLVEASVEGWEEAVFVHHENITLVMQAAAGALQPQVTTLLSPFDPVVWDRRRCRELFGFDFSIECYLPQPKRRYGYYLLPILHRGRLVGRLDAKAHRKEGIFEVKALYLEPDVDLDEVLLTGLAGALQACADWHAAPQVVLGASDPPELADYLKEKWS